MKSYATYVSVELAISKSEAKDNKQVFDELKSFESEIDDSFGELLSWERLDNKKMCRIAHYLEGVNVFQKDDWDKMTAFLVENMIKLEKAMREPLKKVRNKLKLNTPEENITVESLTIN